MISLKKQEKLQREHEEDVKAGDLVVLVTGISETGTTNTLKVEEWGLILTL